jgi:ribosomal protein S18 acetylase RimI-like enzyme
MYPFSNNNIAIANGDDVPAITKLLNSAYRGESSTHGWTTEAYLIAGEVRTDENHLQEVMQRENSEVLKYTNEEKQIIGCVNLQQHGKKIYLGMLSVDPKLQGMGVGKHLLKAAEEYALQLKCTSIYMTVISVRTELVAWYERHGYSDTGERKAFEEDGLTGKHLRPLEFMVLEKKLAG